MSKAAFCAPGKSPLRKALNKRPKDVVFLVAIAGNPELEYALCAFAKSPASNAEYMVFKLCDFCCNPLAYTLLARTLMDDMRTIHKDPMNAAITVPVDKYELNLWFRLQCGQCLPLHGPTGMQLGSLVVTFLSLKPSP